jgi:penicillin G amidase
MKAIRIILFSLLSLVIVAVIAGAILISGIKRGALPQYKGELKLAGLSAPVTVYRDERGMPHIYAENEPDLYFAVGYIMSQERLWQMDLIRRATSGRLSEIFGADYVQTDLFLRSLGIPEKSGMVINNADPAVLESISSFTDGVNAYIDNAGKKLPPEFRILGYKPDQWKREDVANIIGYLGWDLAGGNLSTDIFNYRLIKKMGIEKAGELIPDWKADSTSVFPDFRLPDEKLKEALAFISSMDKLKSLGVASFSGSNNWAVSGKKTETGKPVLSNDMHLALSAPGIWFQMHQVIPGKLNVTGVAVPGEPLIVAGHNEKIAWGMTNLMVDDVDLFSEKINPENNDQYYYDGEWKNMKMRNEIIRIKGGKSDTATIKFTHRGAVISDFRDIKDAVLSMRWSGYDNSDELKAVFLINRAANWEDFRSALKGFNSISQNFAYADVDGNIGLNTGGGVPVRKGYGSIIRTGETSEYDWKGYVPFDQLPSSYNPEKGYVSSANNKTVSSDYPYYISFRFYVPYRISRIRSMLEEKEILGIDDFKRMITDQHSDYARLLTPFVVKLKERLNSMDPSESAAFSSLEEWDFNMDKDKAAPAIFEFLSKSMAKNLLGDELEELFVQLPGSIKDYYIYRILETGADRWVDDINTSAAETLDDIILKSFKDCVKTLSETYGADVNKWTWGSIHRISLDHPLATVKIIDRIFKLSSGKVGVGGSNHTVCPYTYKEGFIVTDGASERHIFNTANWDESYTVIPTGASGVPSSEFYLSQTITYLNGGFYKDAFSDGAVKAAAKYTLKLVPVR